MADGIPIALAVFEQENADRFDGNVYSPTLLELFHKFADGFVNFIVLSLREKQTSLHAKAGTREADIRRWHKTSRNPHLSES